MSQTQWQNVTGLAVLAIAAATHCAAALPTDYLNVKGYTEFFAAPNSSKTFNYSGKAVYHTFPGSGVARITFVELAKWAYRPTLQVTPRTSTSNGMPNCGARLETEGLDLIAVVSCRNGTVAVPQPEFTLMIVDETSDAAYMQVRECTTCIAANVHNPWAREAVAPVRVQRLTNRTAIFFKVDSKETLFDITPPLVLVTPSSPLVSCEVFSIGSKSEAADEYGVEVACQTARNQTAVNNPNPTPIVIDTSFNLLLVPRSARTGFVFASETGSQWFLANENGTIRTVKVGVGRYNVSFGSLAFKWDDEGVAFVNAHGSGGKNCGLLRHYRSGNDVEVEIACKKSTGEPVDSRFIVVATSRH